MKLEGLQRNLVALRSELVDAALPLGIGVASAGTMPLSMPDVPITETPRFRRMLADYQLLVREQFICGMQVHVGVSDRSLAAALLDRLARWLPPLLALSTSSPFSHDGTDTGYGIAVLAGTATTAILGNRIGTDVTGSAKLSNAGGGIFVNTPIATSVTIGGASAGEGNLISGNPFGINVVSDSTATILGNRIGTNAAGTATLSGGIGINTNLTPGSTRAVVIGGNAPGAGNLISGNINGISVANGGAISIAGNLIGTNAAGTAAIRNQLFNIQIVFSCQVIRAIIISWVSRSLSSPDKSRNRSASSTTFSCATISAAK